MHDVWEWNKIIYKNPDGTFVGKGMHAEEFWNEFQIKSYPKFEGHCYYHIPERWAEDVRLFLKQVQSELKDRISFDQIKEKFCMFTVYYRSTDDEARRRMKELIGECIERLVKKGVHPPTEQKEQGNAH